ncbi:MAG: serine hydrolase, partial [bacterium]|nr:serine hydrolase [bacterium]
MHIKQHNQPNQHMLRFLLVLFLLFAGIGFQYGKSEPVTVDLSKLDNYIEQARKAWRIPGLSVAIVKDGKVVLSKGYGVKEFSKRDKVDDKTLFAIASNTKAFTAASLAILVDEGKLSWNDRVRKHLPYFQLYDPYVSNEMRVVDLLCHRSGLGTFSGDLLWYETPYSTVEIIKRARYLKPKFSFRNGYGYSNLMFMTAGEVVPAVTGQPWKEFVKERIFKPLGMATTNIGTNDLKKYGNVSTPHYVYHGGKTITVPYSSSDSSAGAAAMNSNASDMARWIMMLLNKGKLGDKQIISQARLEDMWTPYNTFKVSEGYRKAFPTVNFRGYGLGFGLMDYNGHKVASHGGALDGMISRVALVPEINLGMVILTNSINGLTTALMYRIIDTYQGAEPKDWSGNYLKRYQTGQERSQKRQAEKEARWAKKSANSPRPNNDDFTGLYGGPMYGDATISKKDQNLVLKLLPASIFTSDLSHLYFDTFKLKLRGDFSFIP